MYGYNYGKDGTDRFDGIRTCLYETLPDETAQELASSRTASVTDMLNDTDGKTLLVEVLNALTPHQAVAVQTLAACTRKRSRGHYEHRSFDSDGGNDVTFLNTLLQIFLPRVAATLQKTAELAYETAQWDYIPNLELVDCGRQNT